MASNLVYIITFAIIYFVANSLSQLMMFGKVPKLYDVKNDWNKKWKQNKFRSGCTTLVPRQSSQWYYPPFMRTEWEERFPFSSTILVAFTDSWHLVNLISNFALNSVIFLILRGKYQDETVLLLVVCYIFSPVIRGILFELTDYITNHHGRKRSIHRDK